jgi:two-component system response regulator YesN
MSNIFTKTREYYTISPKAQKAVIAMKLLVADDEDYTREGIVENITWSDYGITEIMQARDGAAALRISKWFLPDIVITDIRMPKMNGLEVAKQLVGAHSRVIFITGYMEIDYLKSAIDLSAAAFIEKPIDLQKLIGAVEKAVKDVRARQRQYRITEDMKGYKRRQRANMLIYKNHAMDMVKSVCVEAGFPVKGFYQCLLLWNKSGAPYDIEAVGDILTRHGCGWLENSIDSARHLFIVCRPGQDNASAVCDSVLNAAEGTVLGAGVEVGSISLVYSSYQTAELALNGAFFETDRRLFTLEEDMVAKKELELTVYTGFSATLHERPEQLRDWVCKFCDELMCMRHVRKERILALVSSLAAAVYNEHGDLYISPDCAISRREDIESCVNALTSVDDVRALLLALADAVNAKFSSKSKHYKLIACVKKDIYANFSNPGLTVNDIAAKVNFSPTYLNVLFKQETKSTLKQFLQDYRIERAKKNACARRHLH